MPTENQPLLKWNDKKGPNRLAPIPLGPGRAPSGALGSLHQPAAREVQRQPLSARRPRRFCRPLPRARPIPASRPLPLHRLGTRGPRRTPNKWAGQSYCVHFATSEARRFRTLHLRVQGAQRPTSTGAQQPPRSPRAPLHCPPVAPRRGDVSVPRAQAPARDTSPPDSECGSASRRDSGDLRRPRQDPLSSLCSVPAPRKLRPSPAARAYPCWRLRGRPATGELGAQAGGLFFLKVLLLCFCFPALPSHLYSWRCAGGAARLHPRRRWDCREQRLAPLEPWQRDTCAWRAPGLRCSALGP